MLKLTLSLLMLSSFAFAEIKCVEHEVKKHQVITECKMPNNDICYILYGKISCVSHQK